MSNPTLLQMPLAVNGDKNTIPVETGSNTGLFSQKYGFQSINSLPLSAGGKAISRHDYNGAMYLLSNILFYAQKGYTFEFDSTQAYFAGCEVIDTADGNKYRCTADVAAEGDSPSEDPTHWERIFNESAFFYRMPSTTYTVGDVKYAANLPSWGFLTCITGGEAGSGELVIPAGTKAGDTITDGEVVWRLDSLTNMKKALAESTGYGIVSGCEPTISGLTVTVGAGIVHLADGTRKELAQTSVTLDSADPSNPRIDLVYIDSTGTVAKITGTASASPVVPALPSGGISVCTVTIAAGASTGIVTDKRDIKNFINYDEVENAARYKSYTQAFNEWEERKALDESEETLTVATFNILNECDYRKVGAVAAVIAARQKNIILQTKAQVIGLNEVTKTNFFTPLTYHSPTGPIKYVDRIYTDYNMVETAEPESGYIYGECFLSAYQINNKSTGVYSQPTSGGWGYAHGIVKVGNKDISIYVTHFDSSNQYINNQITELLQVVSADNTPYKIIMGDFNFDVGTETTRISMFTNAGFRGVNAGKYKTYLDNLSIDEIMITSNIDIIESGCIHVTDANGYVVGTQAGGYKAISDHSPVYARLRFN